MSKSYIEVEAFVSSEQEIYCKDCARRKGIKNGKERFIYEIGDTPCRACGIMDVLDDVEAYSEAFPADVKPAVPHEMSAVEYARALYEMSDVDLDGAFTDWSVAYHNEDFEEAVAIVEQWAREHLEERSEDNG